MLVFGRVLTIIASFASRSKKVSYLNEISDVGSGGVEKISHDPGPWLYDVGFRLLAK